MNKDYSNQSQSEESVTEIIQRMELFQPINETNDIEYISIDFSEKVQNGSVVKRQSNNSQEKLNQEIIAIENKRKFFSEDTSPSPNYQQIQFDEIFEEEIFFKWGQFTIAFIYHFLGQILIGPIIYFIGIIFGHQTFIKNMAFAPSKKVGNYFEFCIQMLLYIFIISSILYYQISGTKTIFAIEIYSILIQAFVRIIIISAKYGSMARKKFKIIKCQLLHAKMLVTEQILDWAKQRDEQIEREITFNILRNDFDANFLKIYFQKEVNERLDQKLKTIEAEFPKFQPNIMKIQCIRKTSKTFKIFENIVKKEIAQQSENSIRNNFPLHEVKTYDAGTILFDIYQNSKKYIFSQQFFTKLIFFITIIHGSIPFIFRKIQNDTIFGSTISEMIISILVFLTNGFFYFINLIFIFYSLVELQRQVYVLKQLTLLLSPKQSEYINSKKIYPSINIFCPMSIHSWCSMHQVARDYGKKYKIRIEGYITLVLLFYTLIFLIWSLSIFKILPSIHLETQIILIFELLIILIVALLLIVIGIQINSFYERHIRILQKNRQYACQLYCQRQTYFTQKEKTNNVIFDTAIQCIKNYVSQIQQGQKQDDAIEQHLTNIMTTIDSALQQIQFKKEFEKFKIMGFEATPTFLNSLLTVLGSLLFTLFSFATKDNSKQI